MPPLEVELQRRNQSLVLVPWAVNDDGTDPVADAAARATLVDILAELQGTLAAVVSGTVALDADSLAALESINALVSGTVALDSPTLALLASQAKQDVGNDYLSHTQNKFKPNVRITGAQTVSAGGNNTIYTPATGKFLRVHWIGMSASQDNGGETAVSIKFGLTGAVKYKWRMGNPGAFSHWEPLDGAVDAPLIANLSVGYPVDVNYTLEELT